MKKKFHMVPMTVVLLLSISTATYARVGNESVWDVPSNYGPVYARMGGHGGMGGGGRGGGMMGSGGGISDFLETVIGKRGNPERDRDIERDREELRREIREKRRELAYLFRSDNPNRRLIDQKIGESNRLEAEWDE